MLIQKLTFLDERYQPSAFGFSKGHQKQGIG